jgi:hypothetical protein
MKDICLGKKETGENIYLNFEEEDIRFTLLAGETSSGKSIFHNNLYKELSEKHTPAEIGFLFLDMTRIDFTGWNSAYLVRPTIVDGDEALDVLNNLRDEKRTVFVHIEECDMVHFDRAKFEKGLDKILKENKNVYVVYSTSRIDPAYLPDWMEKYVDLKAVFQVATKDDSELLLGNDTAFNFNQRGERVLAFKDRQIKCNPFSDEEVTKLVNFKLSVENDK